MEKELTKEEAQRKLKTQLKMLELQGQIFDEKINKIRNEIHDVEKHNKKLIKENGDKTQIDSNLLQNPTATSAVFDLLAP